MRWHSTITKAFGLGSIPGHVKIFHILEIIFDFGKITLKKALLFMFTVVIFVD